MTTVVAIDAMGGDHAPKVVVEGAVAAANELDVSMLLVGRRDLIEPLLEQHGPTERVEVVDAATVIGMHDHPATAVRQKPDSSLVVGVKLVREGRASAFVSAGSTGALMAAGLFELKRIAGVERPAIGALFPTARGKTLIIDVGANADCKPEHLAQFGVMGSAYLERVFDVHRPSVGLLSIGEEETKGNALVLAAHPLLKQLPIHFVGNIEGRDIPHGTVDVAVCDGFTGNVVLKLAEGMAGTITSMIRAEINASLVSKVAAVGVLPAFRRVRTRLDHTEYGGAPLLGINGVCIVAHGSSNAKSIRGAIRVAVQAVEHGLVDHIARGIGDLPTPR